MMETIEEAQIAEGVHCEVCGSNNFVNEGGYFFCQVCQTQSQDAREYVEREEFVVGHRDVRSTQFKGVGGGFSKSDSGRNNLNAFEAFNCCIKLITDRIIQLGFPETLRNQVFNLWTKYLLKREAIFVHPSGIRTDCSKSAACLVKRSRRKRKVRKNNKKGPILNDESLLSVNVQKRKRTLTQMKAMEETYSSQLAELMDQMPETPTDGSIKARKSLQRQACKLTKHSKQVLWAIQREGLPRTYIAKSLLQSEIFNMKSLLAIIFISMRQIGCKVLMTDVIRMIWSGSIYFSSLRLVLGEECANISGETDAKFSNQIHNYLSLEYSDTIINLITYLGLNDFSYPAFEEFLPKFIDDLKLPRELECLILQMYKVLPTDSNQFFENQPSGLKSYRVLPEFHILSVILVVLRLLFGMDDVTERYQSEFARKVNSVIISNGENDNEIGKEWTRLFVVEDWFSYLRQRRRIFEAELINPAFYQISKNPSAAAVNHFVKNYTGDKGINFIRKNEESKRLETAQMFHSYARLRPESQTLPAVLPSYSCVSLPEEDVIQQYKANYPRVLNQQLMLGSLSNSFAKTRIDFILNPTKYVKLLENNGYRVRVLDGDARRYKDLDKEEEGTVIIFQPFKSFDDHMPKVFSYPSSLKLVVSLCSTILSGLCGIESTNEKIEQLTESLQQFYSRHLKCGILNIFPYDLSDSDATTDSDSD